MANKQMSELMEIMAQAEECYMAYKCGKETNDPVMMEDAQRKHGALMAGLQGKGREWQQMFNLLDDKLDRENSLIDFHDTIWERDIPATVSMLRAFGVERFTVSNGATGMNETIWEFIKQGCRIERMALVNDRKRFGREEWDTVPAFVLVILPKA